MTIDENTYGLLCICALRYCHGRQTYIANQVQAMVNLNKLSNRDLRIISNDEKDLSWWHMPKDIQADWGRFYARVDAEMLKRGMIK